MAEKISGTQRRDPGLRALSGKLSGLTEPLLRGRSRAEASLLQDWARIAGAELAAVSRVARLTFPKQGERRNARLTLDCEPGAALDLQHATPQIVERVNGYFGFALVAEIALRQRHLPRAEQPPHAKRAAPPDPETLARAQALTAEIEDAELRAAMTRLAAAISAPRGGHQD